MKLICSKSNLLRGVNIVSKAVPTRTTMAILECILIDASTNEIKLMANDMELGIETRVEGEIAERGVIALDAKIFSEIVRKLPDSDVMIEKSSMKSSDDFRIMMLPLRPMINMQQPLPVKKQNSILLENPEMIFRIFHTLKKMMQS